MTPKFKQGDMIHETRVSKYYIVLGWTDADPTGLVVATNLAFYSLYSVNESRFLKADLELTETLCTCEVS